MGRQRNMAQMKEQNKTPEKELNKMEITNLSDAVFKTLVLGCSKNALSMTTTKGRNEGYTKRNK